MKQSAMLRFREDEIILRQGGLEREMYKIISGKAAVYFNFGKPDEYLVGILSEQRCFGELSLLCSKPSIYTVVAFGDVLVLRITEENFSEFIKQNPKNAIDIMKNLANTIATLSMNLNMLTEDLTAVVSAKNEAGKLEDITQRIRQCAALDSLSKALFSTTV